MSASVGVLEAFTTVELCVMLNLPAVQTLGCPVTVTTIINNGNNASKL